VFMDGVLGLRDDHRPDVCRFAFVAKAVTRRRRENTGCKYILRRCNLTGARAN